MVLRRRRLTTTRPVRSRELSAAAGESRTTLKVTTVGLVCLGLGVGTGYLMWGTRTMELAREVASLKTTLADHARDAIAERTELEEKLRATEVELVRLRGEADAEAPPNAPGLAPTSRGPRTGRAGTEPEVEAPSPRGPPVRRQSPSSTPAAGHTPEGGRPEDSAVQRSDGRVRRAPLELPRRPPDLSGSLPSPTSP
jgi:hypothetical protein